MVFWLLSITISFFPGINRCLIFPVNLAESSWVFTMVMLRGAAPNMDPMVPPVIFSLPLFSLGRLFSLSWR